MPSVRAAHTFAEAAAVAAALSVADVAVASDTAAEADSATADEVTLEVLAEKLVDAACGNHSVHVIRISRTRAEVEEFPVDKATLVNAEVDAEVVDAMAVDVVALTDVDTAPEAA